jgi:hypothetical protein
VKLCVEDQTCAKLCKGGKADKDKARARMAEFGLSEETKSGTRNCGVVLTKDEIRILRGAAYGLAKAALAANKRGYVLRVSSAYRSMLEQLE